MKLVAQLPVAMVSSFLVVTFGVDQVNRGAHEYWLQRAHRVGLGWSWEDLPALSILRPNSRQLTTIRWFAPYSRLAQ